MAKKKVSITETIEALQEYVKEHGGDSYIIGVATVCGTDEERFIFDVVNDSEGDEKVSELHLAPVK